MTSTVAPLRRQRNALFGRALDDGDEHPIRFASPVSAVTRSPTSSLLALMVSVAPNPARGGELGRFNVDGDDRRLRCARPGWN
jgi:hypothetical protein